MRRRKGPFHAVEIHLDAPQFRLAAADELLDLVETLGVRGGQPPGRRSGTAAYQASELHLWLGPS
jgi:hypothetical protein